jgi:hypothetical protein
VVPFCFLVVNGEIKVFVGVLYFELFINAFTFWLRSKNVVIKSIVKRAQTFSAGD